MEDPGPGKEQGQHMPYPISFPPHKSSQICTKSKKPHRDSLGFIQCNEKYFILPQGNLQPLPEQHCLQCRLCGLHQHSLEQDDLEIKCSLTLNMPCQITLVPSFPDANHHSVGEVMLYAQNVTDSILVYLWQVQDRFRPGRFRIDNLAAKPEFL